MNSKAKTIISLKKHINKYRKRSKKTWVNNHRRVNKRHSALLNRHGNLRKLATSSKVIKTTPSNIRKRISKKKVDNIKSLLNKHKKRENKRRPRTRSKLATHHKSAKNLKKNKENRILKEYNFVNNANEAKNLVEYNLVNNANEARNH